MITHSPQRSSDSISTLRLKLTSIRNSRSNLSNSDIKALERWDSVVYGELVSDLGPVSVPSRLLEDPRANNLYRTRADNLLKLKCTPGNACESVLQNGASHRSFGLEKGFLRRLQRTWNEANAH